MMTQEEFDKGLTRILDNMTASELLTIAGIYEIVSEHFNNDVIADYNRDHTEEAI